jgi:hypothetical protein
MTSSSETHTSSPPHMPRISLRSSNDASNFQATRAPTVSRRPTRTQHLPELSRSTSTTRLPSHSTSTSTSTQTPRSVPSPATPRLHRHCAASLLGPVLRARARAHPSGAPPPAGAHPRAPLCHPCPLHAAPARPVRAALRASHFRGIKNI